MALGGMAAQGHSFLLTNQPNIVRKIKLFISMLALVAAFSLSSCHCEKAMAASADTELAAPDDVSASDAQKQAIIDSAFVAVTAEHPLPEKGRIPWTWIITVAVAVWEVVVRVWPTKVNLSVLDILHIILSRILPNRALFANKRKAKWEIDKVIKD
jgi:hypothetical protein